ncbi:hypothetical protein FDUTEX481_01170 [Tolypothrix sp. PCC 7601]|nr:hypothetical protein FDUTEX481_01170 [Tolypothrix sp. PCC 7601]
MIVHANSRRYEQPAKYLGHKEQSIDICLISHTPYPMPHVRSLPLQQLLG